jgi:hypothetical protein
MAAIPGFIGGAYAGANPVSAHETLINWYPSMVETPGGVAPAELLPTPGASLFGTATVGGGRAAWAGDGRCFVVFGNTLFEVFSDGTVTSRGTLATDDNPATISTNGDAGNQLLVTSGGNAYCYDLTTNTLTLELTGGVLQGGVVDGYGVVLVTTAGTAQFQISDLFDLTTWDPLQFAQRSIQPDLWRAMLVDPYGYISLLGSKTSESWNNVGTSPFPFAPDRSGLMEEGIAAPFSAKQAGKHKVWLATNANGGYQVLAAQGFTPRRISNHGIERAIAGYADVSDAFADTYEAEGHAFYLLTFPSAGVTWCYDFATQLWHRRGTWITGAFTYWRPAFHCFAFGKHLAVDLDSTSVLEIDDATATDVDGLPIVRERQFSAGGRENSRVFFDHLEILAESGVGLTSGNAADVDPRLMLEVSDDYGRTFGPERTASVGARGEYGRKCEWWGLGSGCGRVYRLRASAAVPWRLTAAYQRVRASASLAVA